MRRLRSECIKKEEVAEKNAEEGKIPGENAEEELFAAKKGVLRDLRRKILRVCRPESLAEPVCDPNYRRTHVIRITGGTFGKVVDFGMNDESNMGGAMAPAAADTLLAHLEDTGASPEDYDAIFTGDLGRFGKQAFEYILAKEGIRLPESYTDCGAAYFKPEQETFQGGSGAGCVNTVFNGYIAKRLECGELRKVLVLATGALPNKDTPLQKETIPGVSHAFVAESEEY